MRLNLDDQMPFSRGLKQELLFVCIAGVFVLMAFFLLEPFSFSGLSKIALLVFGLVSIVAAIVYLILTHYLYRTYWSDHRWTVGMEIFHSLSFLAFVGFSTMIYGYMVHISDLSFKSISFYLLYTIAVGIIPVTIRAMLVRSWRLKNDLTEAIKMNELLAGKKLASDEKIIEFQNTSSKEVLKLSNHDLLYVEATENYITVVWDDNLNIKKQMIRMTMKEAIKQANDPLIVFSHRSFIINLRKAQKISSLSGISTVTLKNTDKSIPVSGTYKEAIRLRLKEFK
jgi:hypothetical protein